MGQNGLTMNLSQTCTRMGPPALKQNVLMKIFMSKVTFYWESSWMIYAWLFMFI